MDFIAPLSLPLAVLVLPAVILGWVGPHAASVLVGAKHKPSQMNTIAGKVMQVGKNRGKVWLEFPSSIRVSQTINVRAWLQPDTTANETPLTGKLESSDFRIVSTNASDAASPEYKYQWDWLISADKPGERALYFWVDPSTELAVNSDTANVRLGPAKNKVLLPISVLTDLGLTPTEEAWAKAIGAFVGLLGTVAAFGFWKWNQKQKQNKEPEPGAQPPTLSIEEQKLNDNYKAKNDKSKKQKRQRRNN